MDRALRDPGSSRARAASDRILTAWFWRPTAPDRPASVRDLYPERLQSSAPSDPNPRPSEE